MLVTLLICSLALLLDWLLGEPKRYHPLIGFGRVASAVEAKLNLSTHSPKKQFFLGFIACILLVAPFSLVAYLISQLPSIGLVCSLVVVTLCIGHKSLHEHTLPIANAIQNNNHEHALKLASRIVSRDADSIDIPKATIESILENGSDSVFSALFWFIIAGLPGIVTFRLVNTLDAMWGYKNQRFLYFGRFAARIDDVMNYIPARLTAISYSLLGHTKPALKCWQQQAKLYDSPNGGPVMAAGAGALNVKLGGAAKYHGQWKQRPQLGCGNSASATDINRALRLIRHTSYLWLAILLFITMVSYA